MITIKVGYGENLFSTQIQTKTFDTEEKAIEWCRKNHDKIQSINFNFTYGLLVDHFALLHFIREE